MVVTTKELEQKQQLALEKNSGGFFAERIIILVLTSAQVFFPNSSRLQGQGNGKYAPSKLTSGKREPPLEP